MKNISAIGMLFILGLMGCDSGEKLSDAFGNFEAVPVLVSSQAQGKLLSFDIEEGSFLEKEAVVGVVDTMQLHLRKEQIISRKRSAITKISTIEAQADAQQVQINNLNREYKRVIKLFEDGAATAKQKDDLEGSIALLKAQKKILETKKSTIRAELESLNLQLLQVRDQIEKSFIINPISGLVLQKYKRFGEITAPSQAVYKIADMSHLYLRAYISGNQLSSAKLGNKVTVRFDGADGIVEIPGVITWISSNAEFTPKVIQTREERVNLVYATKIRVKNNGQLKIGMPGEVIL